MVKLVAPGALIPKATWTLPSPAPPAPALSTKPVETQSLLAIPTPSTGLPDTVAGAQTLIAELPWPSQTVYRIEFCESSDNPNARSWEGAVGLMQEMGGSYDPLENIRDAYALWQQRGFEPWTSSESCWNR